MEDAKAEGSGALCSFEVIDRLLASGAVLTNISLQVKNAVSLKPAVTLERLDMQLRLGESWETIGVTIGKLDRRLQGSKDCLQRSKNACSEKFAPVS